MLLVKNSKFLLSLLFFEKGLDMYFYDVVYKWEGFLEYKNVSPRILSTLNKRSFSKKWEKHRAHTLSTR